MSTGFVKNMFSAYRATNKIHLGKYAVDINQDDIFEYDGTTLRHGGVEYDVPQLRGLVGRWFVVASDVTTKYRSMPSGVQVRSATPETAERGTPFSMGSASEEESVVGTMEEAKQVRTAADLGQQERLEALRQSRRDQAARRAGLVDHGYDSNPDAPPPQNADDVDADVEAALMESTQRNYVQARPVYGDTGMHSHATASEAEMRAVAEANRRNSEAIARKAAELAAVDPFKTRDQFGGIRHNSTESGGRVGGGKYGIIRDEQDDGVPVGSYRFSSGATVGNPEYARNEAAARPVDVTRVASQQPVQVGNAVAATPNRHAGAQVIADPMTVHEPQAARAHSTTQVYRGPGVVGIDEIGPGGTTGDAEYATAGDDLTDLMPDAAVAGRVVQASQMPTETVQPRRAVPPTPVLSEDDEIAEIVQGWSTKRNWQKRVEEAVEFYGDWPEALEAIYAIESEAVVKQIKSKVSARV